ncbi:hypothetical protein IEQ34_005643 [Dendrobium chrysotoxum]|uniref:Uncharacterized protein n=1 Tax=Dendrobium chrysotoxum TaxID=161865 RepID=A0AAV7GUH6_DENCH|nr:hypothetical protein IEQ34_005643 [Dendrobium chrysotoxum]
MGKKDASICQSLKTGSTLERLFCVDTGRENRPVLLGTEHNTERYYARYRTVPNSICLIELLDSTIKASLDSKSDKIESRTSKNNPEENVGIDHIILRSKWLDIQTRDLLKSWACGFFFVKNEWNLMKKWENLKELLVPLHI